MKRRSAQTLCRLLLISLFALIPMSAVGGDYIIAYSNGMGNRFEDASTSRDRLRELYGRKAPDGRPIEDDDYVVEYAFSGDGYTRNPICDLAEVYRQKSGPTDSWSAYKKFVAGFATTLSPGLSAAATAVIVACTAAVKSERSGSTYSDTDLDLQVRDYKKFIGVDGKKVLIVAHSQGNLYANLALRRVVQDATLPPGLNIAIVGVASPANEVATGSGDNRANPYETSKSDLVIRGLDLISPSTLDWTFAFTDLPSNPIGWGVYNWTLTEDWKGHGFVPVYTYSLDAWPRVKGQIDDGLQLLASASFAEAFKLPDTGQTKCYQGVSPWAEIPCTGTGQDGEYNINPLSYTDNDNGTVTDNNTGLIWQKQDDGTQRTWDEAVSYCSSFGTNWRLPSGRELLTIVDYSRHTPAINTTYFPNTQPYLYWSSTENAQYPEAVAWWLHFDRGNLYNYYPNKQWNTAYARCVKGQQFPLSFHDNGDGTVLDNNTGLMWQKQSASRPCSPSYENCWQTALDYCSGLSIGTISRWRLPNIKELASIFDVSRYAPALDANVFSEPTSGVYWSSTTDTQDNYWAWLLTSYYGEVGSWTTASKINGPFDVRCVRAGQVP